MTSPSVSTAGPRRVAAARRSQIIAGLGVCVALVVAPFVIGPWPLGILTLGLVYGLFAYGLDLSWGRVGLLSVGQAAFFGIGAYGAALADRLDSPILLSSSIAVMLAVVVAIVIAMVAFSVPDSLSAPLFILLTLGVSLLGQRIAASATDVTGGTNGAFLTPLTLIPGYYTVLGVVLLCLAITIVFVVNGRRGMLQLAVLSNPSRAAHLGVNGHRTRLVAFAVSAAVSAIAGVLFATVSGIVTPNSVGLALSTSVLIWVAIGGRRSIAGPFVGAIAITFGTQMLGSTLQSWWILGMAVVFVVVVKVAPGGLAAIVRRLAAGSDIPAVPRRVRILESAEPAHSTGPLLEVTDLRVSLGGSPILNGVDFSVAAGECVCLIGPNGAGKSTLLGAIAGTVPVGSGRVTIGGHEVTYLPVHTRARRGLGRMFQIPSIFDGLTVADNRRIAAVMSGVRPPAFTAVEEALPAAALSMAHRRHLELDMVLEGHRSLLLLDEPAAGLSHDETVALAARIRSVAAERGCGVVIVEHDMELVRVLADRVVVLAQGRVIAEGSMDDVVAHEEVRGAYLGGAS